MNFKELKWFTNDFDQTYRFYKTRAYLRNVHDFLMGTGDTVEVIRHSRGDSTQSRGFDTNNSPLGLGTPYVFTYINVLAKH